jgi:hypothetical protein
MDTNKKEFSLLDFQFKKGYITKEKYDFHKARGCTLAVNSSKDFPKWVYYYIYKTRYNK